MTNNNNEFNNLLNEVKHIQNKKNNNEILNDFLTKLYILNEKYKDKINEIKDNQKVD